MHICVQVYGLECHPSKHITVQDEGRGEIVQAFTGHIDWVIGRVWGAGFGMLSPVAERMQKHVSG